MKCWVLLKGILLIFVGICLSFSAELIGLIEQILANFLVFQRVCRNQNHPSTRWSLKNLENIETDVEQGDQCGTSNNSWKQKNGRLKLEARKEVLFPFCNQKILNNHELSNFCTTRLLSPNYPGPQNAFKTLLAAMLPYPPQQKSCLYTPLLLGYFDALRSLLPPKSAGLLPQAPGQPDLIAGEVLSVLGSSSLAEARETWTEALAWSPGLRSFGSKFYFFVFLHFVCFVFVFVFCLFLLVPWAVLEMVCRFSLLCRFRAIFVSLVFSLLGLLQVSSEG